MKDERLKNIMLEVGRCVVAYTNHKRECFGLGEEEYDELLVLLEQN